MKYPILYLFVLALAISSCEADDDNVLPSSPINSEPYSTTTCICSPAADSSSVIGVWSSISYPTGEPIYDINNDGINSSDLFLELPCKNSTFSLNSDMSFVYENNSWTYDSAANVYGCTSGSDLHIISGTWSANSDNTMLSLDIGPHTSFLYIEFGGKTLKQISSDTFNRNALGEEKPIVADIIYCRK